jgi:hypothetical protein
MQVLTAWTILLGQEDECAKKWINGMTINHMWHKIAFLEDQGMSSKAESLGRRKYYVLEIIGY